MEKRALIAIALSVAVLLAWQLWVGGPPPPDRPQPSAPTGSAPPTAPAPSTPGPGPAQPTPQPRATLPVAPVAEVVTPLIQASFGADGSVTAWTIEYRGAKRLVVGGPLRPLAVAVHRPGQAAELVPLRPDAARLEVTPA